MKHAHDSVTLDLFEVPMPTAPMPGALNFDKTLRRLLSDLLKASPFSREIIAGPYE